MVFTLGSDKEGLEDKLKFTRQIPKGNSTIQVYVFTSERVLAKEPHLKETNLDVFAYLIR